MSTHIQYKADTIRRTFGICYTSNLSVPHKYSKSDACAIAWLKQYAKMYPGLMITNVRRVIVITSPISTSHLLNRGEKEK